MILIADAGSSKIDWIICTSQKVLEKQTSTGFNPITHHPDILINTLNEHSNKKIINPSIKNIFYYGAGCWDAINCQIVYDVLVHFFPNSNIEVESDLLGAARASNGNQKGITCILGTGTNTCLYDGTKIIDNIPALGYIIGDEGSGAFLGKQLLSSYFYRTIPAELNIKLENKYNISKTELIKSVYKSPGANQYLASFVSFLVAEKEHSFIKKLILEGFDTLIKKQLLKYEYIKQLPVHFIGSIAFFFHQELETMLTQHGLKIGKIIRHPIEGLVHFHQKNY